MNRRWLFSFSRRLVLLSCCRVFSSLRLLAYGWEKGVPTERLIATRSVHRKLSPSYAVLYQSTHYLIVIWIEKKPFTRYFQPISFISDCSTPHETLWPWVRRISRRRFPSIIHWVVPINIKTIIMWKNHSRDWVLSARRTVFGNFLIYRVNSAKRDVGGIPARLVDLTNRLLIKGWQGGVSGSNELSIVYNRLILGVGCPWSRPNSVQIRPSKSCGCRLITVFYYGEKLQHGVSGEQFPMTGARTKLDASTVANSLYQATELFSGIPPFIQRVSL